MNARLFSTCALALAWALGCASCDDEASCRGSACSEGTSDPAEGDGDAGDPADQPSDAGRAEPDAAPHSPHHDAGQAGDGDDVDAGEPDGEPLELAAFCARALAPGEAWLATFAACCASVDEVRVWELEQVLDAFGLPHVRQPGDAVAACVEELESELASGTLSYHPERAAACADAIAANYTLRPPAECPEGDGFFAPELASRVGKGVQLRSQIPACREAFVGSVARGATCSSHLTCSAGGVCISDISGARCLDPVNEGGDCFESAECAPGLHCRGALGALRLCAKTSVLGAETDKCMTHSECAEGLRCDELTNSCTRVPEASMLGSTGESCAADLFVPHYQCKGYCDREHGCAPLCAP